MSLPDLGVLLAVLSSSALGAAVLLLAVGIRGVVHDPTRPPSATARLLQALRSPALTGRIAGAVLVAVLALVLTHWIVASAGLAALIVFWPQMFGGTKAEQLQIKRLEALVTWTEALRDTTMAHASLEQAIPATAGGAPLLIREPLVRLVGQIRGRLPLERALLGLAVDLDDPSADLVIAALILNVRRRGDKLAQVLTGLAESARLELDLRRRISAGRSTLRRGVQIVILMTIGFALFLVLFSPAYVEPYSRFGGQIALAVVCGLFGAGFVWMRQLAGADQPLPFLSRPGQSSDPADLRLVSGLTGMSVTAAASELAPAGPVVVSR